MPGDTPGLLRFEIRANAFCHQMVRSIVGTLVDVGLGKLHAGDMRGILLQRDRQCAGRSPRRTVWCCGKSAIRLSPATNRAAFRAPSDRLAGFAAMPVSFHGSLAAVPVPRQPFAARCARKRPGVFV